MLYDLCGEFLRIQENRGFRPKMACFGHFRIEKYYLRPNMKKPWLGGPGLLFQGKSFYGEGPKGHPKTQFGASNSMRYSSYGRVKFQFFNGKYMVGPTKKTAISRDF